MLQTPITLAMVICDVAWRDLGTGKWTLIGTFSSIGARDFPAVHPQIGIYIELTDSIGKMPFSVRLVDADEAHPDIAKVDGEIESKDPRAVLQLGINLASVQFNYPGEYRVMLEVGGEFLIERRIVVIDLREKPSGDEE